MLFAWDLLLGNNLCPVCLGGGAGVFFFFFFFFLTWSAVISVRDTSITNSITTFIFFIQEIDEIRFLRARRRSIIYLVLRFYVHRFIFVRRKGWAVPIDFSITSMILFQVPSFAIKTSRKKELRSTLFLMTCYDIQVVSFTLSLGEKSQSWQ